MKDFLISYRSESMVVKMYNRIPESIIKQVQSAHNIIDVIGEHVQLTKRGNNYFGLCPFHDEKTPSFSVSEEKQMFYCFGCKEGGNLISFLMKLKNMSFYETIIELAKQAKIELPNIRQPKHQLSSEAQKIYEANEWLTKLYHHLLRYTKEGKQAYQYLENRGISKKSIDTFHIGYSPNIKHFTAKFLKKKGILEQTLIKSGLFVKTDHQDELYDRFTGRVVFPIRDNFGRPVGFSARSITNQDPKYINSSESEIFQKQQLLYNFDLAKGSIRKEKEAILFEGQLDVITAYQYGLTNVIATLGTSLTEFQVKLLRRYANKVILCFDGDLAGQRASYRAANLLRNYGFEVSIAKLGVDEDPDQYILTHGIETFKRRILDESESYIKFYMDVIQSNYNLSNETEKLQYIKEVIKEISTLNSSIEQDYYIQHLGEQFSISTQALKDELDTIKRTNKRPRNKSSENRYTKTTTLTLQNQKLLPAFHKAERKLISLMLKDATIANHIQYELGADFNIDDHKVIVTNLYAFYEDNNQPDVSLFLERLQDERIRNLAAEISMLSIEDQINEQGIKDYISVIKKQYNDITAINKYKEKQRLAEQENDPIKAAKIGMKILELQKQLKQSK